MQEIAWQQMTLRDYWQLIKRRKRSLLLPLLIVVALATPGVFLITPMYRADTVLISDEVERGSILKGLASIPIPQQERLDTVRQKIYSRSNLKQVADQLGIQAELQAAHPRTPIAFEDVVRYLRRIIHIRLLSGKFVEISVTHSRPQRAAEVANTVAQVYADEALMHRQEEVSASFNFIRDQLEVYKKRLEESERKLAEAKESGIMESLTEENIALIDQASKVDADLTQLGIDIQKTGSELTRLRGLLPPNLPPSAEDYYIYTDPELKALETQIGTLEAQEKLLLQKYDAQWPAVQSVQDQLKILYEQRAQLSQGSQSRMNVSQAIRDQESQLKDLQIRRSQLLTQKSQYNRKLSQLSPVNVTLSSLIREKTTNEQIYSMWLSRLNEAETLRTSELRNMGIVAKVMDPALVPERPFKPDKRRLVILAAILGLTFGVSLALVLELFDHSIHSLEEAERFFPNVPAIGVIPEIQTPKVRRHRRRVRMLQWTAGTLVMMALGVAAVDLIRVQFYMENSYLAEFARFLIQGMRGVVH